MSDPHWMVMLRAAIDRMGSIQAVADQLDYSRTMISLVVNGKYGDRSTAALQMKVLAKLDFVQCPHQDREIERATCERLHRGRMPQSHPDQLRQWVACQRCPVRAAALAIDDLSRKAAG